MAHHFDTPEQQFDSGKLGMWIFLITEVMFFSGLFAAYTVYRGNHPEIFAYAHQFLNKTLGGINTAVLIFSSLTMAWAVRNAQLGQKKALIVNLTITLFCAALFLGVKTFEYTEKYHKRLLWSGAVTSVETIGRTPVVNVSPTTDDATFEARVESSLTNIQRLWILPGLIAFIMAAVGFWMDKSLVRSLGICGFVSVLGIVIGIQGGLGIHHMEHSGGHGESHASADGHSEHANAESEEDTHSKASNAVKGDNHKAAEDGKSEKEHAVDNETALAEHGGSHTDEHGVPPRNMNVFFSIYYFMTGLHAFHIIGGMIAITWLIVRAFNGDFRPDYFGPVDYVGLYWHLVDLIWIYLFPLLYLINM